MLDFRDSDARELLFHPVMETYLELKWKKVRKFFFFNFASYLIFLIAYSLFLGNLFYRESTNKKIKITDLIGLIGGNIDQANNPSKQLLNSSRIWSFKNSFFSCFSLFEESLTVFICQTANLNVQENCIIFVL
jgi:hypothetical protein